MKNSTINLKKQGCRARTVQYISMFSGVECASLAVKPLGWTPICFSEIEPFPCAVLAHRFPGVPNVGDMTRHDWSLYRGKCDVVIGGSPCQAFSVAGRRESLADGRGNLTLSYAEAVNAIDPCFTIWENVPGILSTKDNAFGSLLGVLAGCRSPVVLPRGRKWPNAGVVAGPRRILAWRVLDAQFFGVPQRRRRVFLVGCPRTSGFDPAEILFERESLRGHSPPGGKTGKDAAGAVGGGIGRGRGAGHWEGGVHPSLSQSHNSGGIGMSDQELFSQRGAGLVGAVSAKWAKGTGGPSGDECQNLVAGTLCGSGAGTERPAGQGNELDYLVTHTLRGGGFDASEDGTGRGTPLVALHGSRETGVSGCAARPAGWNQRRKARIAYAISTAHTKGNGKGVSEGIAYTLEQAKRQAVAFTQNQAGDILTGGVCGALGTNQNATGRNTAKVLAAKGEGAADAPQMPLGVRRLTPRECERLQGIPDDHTLIPYRGKPAADGPRYKAVGNGMAVPCVGWILQRIHNHFL